MNNETKLPDSSKNYSSFENIQLGRLNKAKEAITAEDYIKFKMSKGFGRVFTQLKLALVDKKGWLNEDSARELFGNLDWKKLNKIHSKCHETLKPAQEDITRAQKSNKKLENVSQNLPETTKRSVDGANALKTMVEGVVQRRDKAVKEKLTFILKDAKTSHKEDLVANLKGNKLLGALFNKYLDDLKKPGSTEIESIHKGHAIVSAAQQVIKIGGTHSLHQEQIIKGFIESLAEGMVEGRFLPEEKKAIDLAIAANKLEQTPNEWNKMAKMMVAAMANNKSPIEELKKAFPQEEFKPLINMIKEIVDAEKGGGSQNC